MFFSWTGTVSLQGFNNKNSLMTAHCSMIKDISLSAELFFGNVMFWQESWVACDRKTLLQMQEHYIPTYVPIYVDMPLDLSKYKRHQTLDLDWVANYLLTLFYTIPKAFSHSPKRDNAHERLDFSQSAFIALLPEVSRIKAPVMIPHCLIQPVGASSLNPNSEPTNR